MTKKSAGSYFFIPPVILFIIAVVFIPILVSLISSAKLSQTPKASDCSSNECFTSSGCQLQGFQDNGNVCMGSNQWKELVIPLDVSKPYASISAPPVPVDLNRDYQQRASQKDPSVAIIESCHILFWNIVPPPVPVEQARAESEQMLGPVQKEIEQGMPFRQACEGKALEISLAGKTYLQIRFSIRTAPLNQPWFNPAQNPGINERIQQMQIGELLFFPLYDGGYSSDELIENDATYLAGYRLLKRVQ